MTAQDKNTDNVANNINDIAENHGHVPVMRERMAQLLAPAIEAAGSNAVVVDGTLGAGGYADFSCGLSLTCTW